MREASAKSSALRRSSGLPAAARRVIIHIQDVHRNPESSGEHRPGRSRTDQRQASRFGGIGGRVRSDGFFPGTGIIPIKIRSKRWRITCSKKNESRARCIQPSRVRRKFLPFIGVDSMKRPHYDTDANVNVYRQSAPLISQSVQEKVWKPRSVISRSPSPRFLTPISKSSTMPSRHIAKDLCRGEITFVVFREIRKHFLPI